MSQREEVEEKLHPFANYLDVAEGKDEIYVFLRHVSPPVYNVIQETVHGLRGVMLNHGERDGAQRATWKIEKAAYKLRGPGGEIVLLEPEAEL